jgi:glycine betaine/proline transport system ATP-binding protein
MIQIRDLWKVFGEKPERAFRLIEQNFSRDEIKKQIGNIVALRGVNFEITKGEIFVVMGLSGCGKSTLLRCINRLVEPSRGEVVVAGEYIQKFSKEQLIEFRRKKVGMVFQGFALFPHRTVLENAVFGLEIQGFSKKDRIEKGKEALAQVELAGWEESHIESLSGGMQQRVGLARALATEPEILLMDEPFSALDPLIRAQMQDELLRLHKQFGRTIVFVTHDLQEAIKIGDRIGMLDREGSMAQVGTAAEIFRNPSSEYVKSFVEHLDKQAERIAQL